VDILFDFSDGSDRFKAYVVGMMTKPIQSTRSKILALRFKPGQAYSFFKGPMSEITDQAVDLKELLAKDEYLKFKRVFDFEFSTSKLGIIESSLELMLGNLHGSDQRVFAAVNMLERYSVEEISNKLNMTRQHLRRIFSQYVGISPKKFSNIRRLNSVVGSVRKSGTRKADWASIAQDFDYTDQSHLIREFKAISGLTPTQYFG
jgi:AraC-like DNA-binding protein